MIQWLQNYSGTGIHGVNVEKSELQNLRKEIKHYKKNMKKKTKKFLSCLIMKKRKHKKNKI